MRFCFGLFFLFDQEFAEAVVSQVLFRIELKRRFEMFRPPRSGDYRVHLRMTEEPRDRQRRGFNTSVSSCFTKAIEQMEQAGLVSGMQTSCSR